MRLSSLKGWIPMPIFFLNGSHILRSQNMFTGHKVPVKKHAQGGKNMLYIRFYSPVQTMMPARATYGYDYPAGNDHREEKLSVYNRKAPYHFGWDWGGIRIVQMGIWKPVSLLFYNDMQIEDYYVKQSVITKEKAEIEHQIQINSLTGGEKQPLFTAIRLRVSSSPWVARIYASQKGGKTSLMFLQS